MSQKNTFINDSKKAWNKSPVDIKNASSLNSAKVAIKKFVKMLPVWSKNDHETHTFIIHVLFT